MHRTVVKVYGVLIALLAAVGLFVNEGRVLGFMNTDAALDWLRVGLALVLLYIGFFADSAKLVRAGLWTVGVLYLGMGVVGMIDPELWGFTPSGLTGFDVALHLVAGLLAVAVVAKKDTEHGQIKA